MNDFLRVGLGVAIGVVLALSYKSIAIQPNTPEKIDGNLPGNFGDALGFNGPLAAKWQLVHSDDGMKFWADDSIEAFAVSKDGRAVLFFSYLDDVQYFDIFDSGEPKITAEIAPNAQRMFVYSDIDEEDSWVYLDKDIDGVPEQRLIPGTAGSAQDLQVKNLATDK